MDKPLRVVTADNDIPEESFQNVHFVSFRKNEWGDGTQHHVNKVALDTVSVILEVVDTGIYIEHFFALRNGQWFLFQIMDSST
jgi:hypothetical protein